MSAVQTAPGRVAVPAGWTLLEPRPVPADRPMGPRVSHVERGKIMNDTQTTANTLDAIIAERQAAGDDITDAVRPALEALKARVVDVAVRQGRERSWCSELSAVLLQLFPEGPTQPDTVWRDDKGFGCDGFDREGFNTRGLNCHGFDREGFNSHGFDQDGYDRDGFNYDGWNREGRDRRDNAYESYTGRYGPDGLTVYGFDRAGYDLDGYDRTGYDRDGYDHYGFDRNGFNREGINTRGFDTNGANAHGLNRYGEYVGISYERRQARLAAAEQQG